MAQAIEVSSRSYCGGRSWWRLHRTGVSRLAPACAVSHELDCSAVGPCPSLETTTLLNTHSHSQCGRSCLTSHIVHFLLVAARRHGQILSQLRLRLLHLISLWQGHWEGQGLQWQGGQQGEKGSGPYPSTAWPLSATGQGPAGFSSRYGVGNFHIPQGPRQGGRK